MDVADLVVHLPDAVALVGAERVVRAASEQMSELLGRPVAEIAGRDVLAFVHPDDHEVALRDLTPAAAHTSRAKVRVHHVTGDYRWCDVATRQLPSAGSAAHATLLSARDVTADVQHLAVVERRSLEDALTGVANRRGFEALIDEATIAAARTRAGVGLVLVDVDDFKAVNDTYGHGIGDDVLRAVASRLREAAGPANPVARLGGDEFVVVCPHLAAEDELVTLATRVLIACQGELGRGTESVRYATSVGAALAFPEPQKPGAVVRGLLDAADRSMYAHKRTGLFTTSRA